MEVPGLVGTEPRPNMTDWLKNQFADEDYILMPHVAQGKYKDRWNWIHFRSKDQAMLFKLTWA